MRTSPSIRPATTDDLPELDRLKRAASLIAVEYRESLLAHPELLSVSEEAVRAGEILLAEVPVDGGVEGVGMIAVSEGAGLEITGLFVDPARWHQGIGRQLMEHATAHYGVPSAGGVHVVASPDAEGFYRACGFVTTGETATPFGRAVRMRRDPHLAHQTGPGGQ